MISFSDDTFVPGGSDREKPGPMVGCILTDMGAVLLCLLPLALVLDEDASVLAPELEGTVLSIPSRTNTTSRTERASESEASNRQRTRGLGNAVFDKPTFRN